MQPACLGHSAPVLLISSFFIFSFWVRFNLGFFEGKDCELYKLLASPPTALKHFNNVLIGYNMPPLLINNIQCTWLNPILTIFYLFNSKESSFSKIEENTLYTYCIPNIVLNIFICGISLNPYNCPSAGVTFLLLKEELCQFL